MTISTASVRTAVDSAEDRNVELLIEKPFVPG